MSRELTEIPGIGPKTADSLHEIGITSESDLWRRYLASDPERVRNALHSERRLLAHLFRHDDASLTDMSVGEASHNPSAVVAFARHRGASHRYLRAHVSYNLNAEDITPEMIDWSTGIVAGQRDVLGAVHDVDAASDTIGYDLSRMDAAPEEAVVDEERDVVEYRLDGVSSMVDREVLHDAEALAGTEYTDPNAVRINSEEDDCLVGLQTEADRVFFLAAPCISVGDGE